jgi:anti-sigma regulatory factor (Ser/Thr protein kinase)
VPFGTGDDVPVLDVDDVTDLSGLRTDAYLAVLGTDLGADTVDDFVFALSEVATNALTHGRPSVRVRLWATPERLVATVSDRGPGIADPFAGYPPPRDRPGTGGVGLWAARQMCDELTFAHVPGEGFTVWLAMGT